MGQYEVRVRLFSNDNIPFGELGHCSDLAQRTPGKSAEIILRDGYSLRLPCWGSRRRYG
jgi:hypothetical protein